MADSPRKDNDLPFAFAPLRSDVQAGFDQLARGDIREYDTQCARLLIEKIKAEGGLRLAVDRRVQSED
jgi:hypothetical protein